ncbi:putative S-adenosyl-L-methionine-dependent methyltransferase [Novymonas esmeraldas]|uniref:Protein arginine methyltransferase NDUFAF7 n=1 Tax=Novymonas esmeraldas TaxID=1808958 RepID=A0AAW0EL06_9TRYP
MHRSFWRSSAAAAARGATPVPSPAASSSSLSSSSSSSCAPLRCAAAASVWARCGVAALPLLQQLPMPNHRAGLLRSTPVRLAMNLHASDMSTPDRATVHSATKKEFKTALCNELVNKITAQGYYPMSQYIKDCLTHPHHGYYATKKNVIGSDAADFITAAEIPFFGDVLAAWVMDAWQKMGTPRVLHLVELGPGRGTLMKTMLKQIQYSNPHLLHFVQVHLVEVGAARREEQKAALAEFQTAQGKIKWWLDLESLPFSLEPTVFIANEYFDALPVAQFRYTERGWVETCVDVDTDPGTEAHLRLVHAPSGSMSAYLIPDDVRRSGKAGDSIEVNTVGMQTMETILKKMVDCQKAACLLIDYGKDDHMHSTLRGIRGHRFVDPLLSPGEVDLSCWVSFRQLRWALERLEVARRHLKWFPVMTQRDFLRENGIDIRLAHVIKDEETKSAMKVLQHYRRLMDVEEMGESYKVFALQTRNFPNVSPFFAEMPLPPLPQERGAPGHAGSR